MRLRAHITGLLAVLVILAGCGGGPGADGSGEVRVVGNIFNQAPGASMSLGLNAAAAPSPLRLGTISQGQPIMVTTEVQNLTGAAIKDHTFEIFIEDAVFLTPEYWSCQKWFNTADGSGSLGMEVWTAYAQPLPACTGPIKDITFNCWTWPTPLDCVNTSYAVDYQPPGDGFWKANGTITQSIAAGSSWTGTIGYGHSAIDIRKDHKALWVVKDSAGNVIATKSYLFDVVP